MRTQRPDTPAEKIIGGVVFAGLLLFILVGGSHAEQTVMHKMGVCDDRPALAICQGKQ